MKHLLLTTVLLTGCVSPELQKHFQRWEDGAERRQALQEQHERWLAELQQRSIQRSRQPHTYSNETLRAIESYAQPSQEPIRVRIVP